MKKYHAVYKGLIDTLTEIIESPESLAFDSALTSEAERTNFAQDMEGFEQLNAQFAKTRDAKAYWPVDSEYMRLIEDFALHFPTFKPDLIRKLQVLTLLYDKISQAGVTSFNDDDIEELLFDLYFVSENLVVHFFAYANTDRLKDSAILICTENLSHLKTELNNAAVTLDLLYHLIVNISTISPLQGGRYALVKRTTPKLTDSAILSFIKLQMAMQGIPTHKAQTYGQLPSLIDKNALDPEFKYQQLKDNLYVLSEYNRCDDLLFKYLTIYHLFENFMYKSKIVELESGRMLSIRDFRRLFREIDVDEPIVLQRLLARILDENVVTGQKMAERVITKWQLLSPGDTDYVLTLLNIRTNKHILQHAKLITEASGLPRYLAAMIYTVRNGIVHNKETEVHLTHASLDPKLATFLRSFLMPVLEEFAFYLMSKRNNIVWYTNSKLVLFDE